MLSSDMLMLCLHYAGISLKTQELYAVVFITRYLDLFFAYVSLCVPPCATLHGSTSDSTTSLEADMHASAQSGCVQH